MREAVAGYRQPTLESELDGARQLLEAAGIDCQIEHTAGTLPSGLDMVLAWTVREGVTNVIRHSRARRCLIRVTREHNSVCAEVSNDWYQGQKWEGTTKETGSGLSGLSERVRVHKGQMEAGPLLQEGKDGFHLRVELPLQGSTEAMQEGKP